MLDNIHDIDVYTMDARTVGEVRSLLMTIQPVKLMPLLGAITCR